MKNLILVFLVSLNTVFAEDFDFIGKHLVNRKSTKAQSDILKEIRINCIRRDVFQNRCVEFEFVELKTDKKTGSIVYHDLPSTRYSLEATDDREDDIRRRVREDAVVFIPGLQTYAILKATRAWWIYALSPLLLTVDLVASSAWNVWGGLNAWRPLLKRKISKFIESSLSEESGVIKISQNNYNKLLKVIDDTN